MQKNAKIAGKADGLVGVLVGQKQRQPCLPTLNIDIRKLRGSKKIYIKEGTKMPNE